MVNYCYISFLPLAHLGSAAHSWNCFFSREVMTRCDFFFFKYSTNSCCCFKLLASNKDSVIFNSSGFVNGFVNLRQWLQLHFKRQNHPIRMLNDRSDSSENRNQKKNKKQTNCCQILSWHYDWNFLDDIRPACIAKMCISIFNDNAKRRS